MKIKSSGGYTLIETIVVLALIGLLILVVLAGSSNSNRVERLGGEVRAFANLIREAQTKAYSVETSSECRAAGGEYARGTLLQYTRGTGSYTLSLICGNDLSPVSGASTAQTDGLRGKAATKTYELNGLNLDAITVGGNPVDNVSIAFLAPDGNAYECVAEPGGRTCEPGPLNPIPFGGVSSNNRREVTFELNYPGVDVRRLVTFETISAKIDVSDK